MRWWCFFGLLGGSILGVLSWKMMRFRLPADTNLPARSSTPQTGDPYTTRRKKGRGSTCAPHGLVENRDVAKTVLLVGDSLMRGLYGDLCWAKWSSDELPSTTLNNLTDAQSRARRRRGDQCVLGPHRVQLVTFTRGLKNKTRLWDNAHYKKGDLLVVNAGAWARTNENGEFNATVHAFVTKMKAFPGFSMWREYLPVHFPTDSGEWSSELGRDTKWTQSCRTTTIHPLAWRRSIPVDIMQSVGIPVWGQYETFASAGGEHRGWRRKHSSEHCPDPRITRVCYTDAHSCPEAANMNDRCFLDCRHWKRNSSVRQSSLATILHFLRCGNLGDEVRMVKDTARPPG